MTPSEPDIVRIASALGWLYSDVEPGLVPQIITEIGRLRAVESEAKRKSALLYDWIATAQSGDNRFGRVMQEPTPTRLREAIAAAAIAHHDSHLPRFLPGLKDEV
jgi:hypothetical protein